MVVCSFWQDKWQKAIKESIVNLMICLGLIIGFWESLDCVDDFIAFNYLKESRLSMK